MQKSLVILPPSSWHQYALSRDPVALLGIACGSQRASVMVNVEYIASTNMIYSLLLAPAVCKEKAGRLALVVEQEKAG